MEQANSDDKWCVMTDRPKKSESLAIRIPVEDVNALEAAAKRERLTRSDFIRFAIKRAIKNQQNGQPVGLFPLDSYDDE